MQSSSVQYLSPCGEDRPVNRSLDQNNNAAFAVEPHWEEVDVWDENANGLSLRDLASFLGEKYETLDRFAHKKIDERLQAAFGSISNGTEAQTESNAGRDLSMRSIISQGVNQFRSSGTLQRISEGETALKDEAVLKKHVPWTIVWDRPPEGNPLKKVQWQLHKRMLSQRKSTRKWFLNHWFHEVQLYAKLNFWAPDLTPQPLPQILESVMNIKGRRTTLTHLSPVYRLANTALIPGMQTNPCKRFLHKFGGLQEFYKHLRGDQLSDEDLNVALALCPFGLSLGTKRSSKTFNPKLLQRYRSRRLTVQPASTNGLHRLLNSSPGLVQRGRRCSSAQMKSPINRAFLAELNQIKSIGAYQSLSTNGDVTAVISLMKADQHEDGDEMSAFSSNSDGTSMGESEIDQEIVGDEDDDDGGGEDAYREPNDAEEKKAKPHIHNSVRHSARSSTSQLSQTRDSNNKHASPVSGLTMESSELRTLDSTSFLQIGVEQETEANAPTGPQNSACTLDMDNKDTLCIPESHRVEKKTITLIPTQCVLRESHSTKKPQVRTSASKLWSNQMTTMGPKPRISVPDLDQQLPVNVIVRTMVEHLNKLQHRHNFAQRSFRGESLAHKIAQQTVKQQPVFARIVRERKSLVESTMDHVANTSSRTDIPDRLAMRLSEGTHPCTLTALRPIRLLSGPNRALNRGGDTRPSGVRSKRDMLPAISTDFSRSSHSGLPATSTMRYKPVCLLPPILSKRRSRFATRTDRTFSTEYEMNSLTEMRNLPRMTSCSVDPVTGCPKRWNRENEYDEDDDNDGEFGGELYERDANVLEKSTDVFMLPQLPPKPKNILFAISHELEESNPFILDYFIQVISQTVPEDRWLVERSLTKLALGLERLGADLLLYRHSSGHAIRFKLMSVIAASESNRPLRRQLRSSAPLQGNWLDQLLRSLCSVHASCRTEAALVIARLLSQPRMMKQFLADRRGNIIWDILHSLFRASDEFPDSWPEFYMTIGFLLHYNQHQIVLNCLLDRGLHLGSVRAATMWPQLISFVYTYWREAVLKQLSVNEKRVGQMLDAAVCHPGMNRRAREAIAFMSKYHLLKSKLVSIWNPVGNPKTCDLSPSTSDMV